MRLSCPAVYLSLPLALLLSACSHTPTSVTLDEQSANRCPLSLHSGQLLMLKLPSNPSTGYRWKITEAAQPQLSSVGAEVYNAPEDSQLIGSAGQSSWIFRAEKPGTSTLALDYLRPWETDVPPVEHFSCQIQVQP